MKFLSVLVSAIICSVSFAYPDQSYQRVSSAKINDPNGVGIQNQNIKSGYAQNEPIPATPIYGPNTYTYTQNTHTSDIQASAAQYGNRVGPELTYQNPQNVHEVQTDAQRINLQNSRQYYQYSPPGPALQHVISQPSLRSLYAALKPTTKYTIIHPNGTIEHTDELYATAARHPNYVMVKAKDILENLDQAKHIGNSNEPSLQKVQNTVTKNSVSTNQRNDNQQYTSIVQTQSTNSKTDSQSGSQYDSQNSATANDVLSSSSLQSFQQLNIPNDSKNSEASIVPPSTLPQQEVSQIQQSNIISQNQETSNKDVENSNAVPLNPAIYQPQSEQEDLKLNSLPQEEAVAANPLPIYPIQSSPITTVSDTAYVSPAAADATTISTTPPKEHPVLKLKNNDEDIIYNPLVIKSVKEASVLPTFDNTITDNKEKQQYPDNLPTPPNSSTTLPISPQNDTLPIILPTVPQETLKEVELPSPVDESDTTAIYNVNISNNTQDNNSKNANSNQTETSAVPLVQSETNPENNDQNVLYNPPVIKSIKEASVPPTFDNTITSNKEKQSNNLPLPSNSTTTLEEPVEMSLPIILPTVPSQKPVTEEEMPSPEAKLDEAINTTQDTNNKSANSSQPFEAKDGFEKNVNKTDLLSSSKPVINGTNEVVSSDLNKISTDNTNTAEVKKNVTNIETLNNSSSVVNDTSKTLPGAPWTWFNFSDEAFWEAVRNNSNNVYFFFMPPRPVVSKEVKTTIFPNGTTLEEITEIVSNPANPDAEPKETTTIRIV